MARIRSIHPGFFTDEVYAFLSSDAQILLIGIWTECDDQGAFDFNPGKLKLRLRPGKDGSVIPLLDELKAANCIMSTELDGRQVGLVRNFMAYQRPKKPKLIFFIPDKFRTYLGSHNDSSEPDDDELESVPKNGEKSPQMEEEGGRRKGGERVEARGSRLPEDFTPDQSCFKKAKEIGIFTDVFDHELSKFRDYWRAVPGAKGRKLDWQSTFRVWLANSTKYQKSGDHHASSSPRTIAAIVAAQRELLIAAGHAEADGELP
jgi:hypothetical protein